MTARFTPHGSSFVRTTLAEADSLLYVTTIQTIDCNRFKHVWSIMSSQTLFFNDLYLAAKQKESRRDYTP
jgi:hypothetical protein